MATCTAFGGCWPVGSYLSTDRKAKLEVVERVLRVIERTSRPFCLGVPGFCGRGCIAEGSGSCTCKYSGTCAPIRPALHRRGRESSFRFTITEFWHGGVAPLLLLRKVCSVTAVDLAGQRLVPLKLLRSMARGL